MDTIQTAKVEKLTITLTDRAPVTVNKDNWPVVASATWKDHDNQYDFQANRKWLAWIKVRQHADGRSIVYGSYDYSTQYQGEDGATYRDGEIVTPTAEDYPESARANFWIGEAIIDAINRIGSRLGERSGSEHFADLAAECIADLPAVELE